MTVYVDAPIWKLGRMTMCHMLADSPEELHAMAESIGVDRSHYQTLSSPHYDICKAKRALAVQFGAVEIDRYIVAEILKGMRTNPAPWIEAARVHRAAAAAAKPTVPYPDFCVHPDKCAGLASCPRRTSCCE